VAKNSVKGYSDTQVKIRDATSNDPWGPSGTQCVSLVSLAQLASPPMHPMFTPLTRGRIAGWPKLLR